MNEPARIEGMKFVYELQPGDKWVVYEGRIIVCNANEKPKIIHSDGRIEELKCE